MAESQGRDPASLIEGKNEDERAQIAGRVGLRLSADNLSHSDRRAAEFLARALAEDAIERVRCELSKAIRHARHLPRDLALKLAHDVDPVACPFLEVTEVFSDSDWQQLLLTISRGARAAVARRSPMAKTLAQSLAQLGDSDVAVTLIENPATPMTKLLCSILMERFGADNWVLDSLALREDLIREIAVKLTARVSAAMRQKLVNTYELPGYTEPLADEAELGAVLGLIPNTPEKDLIDLARTLENKNRLTSSLLLKAMQDGEAAFLEAALSIRAMRSIEHVRSVILRGGTDTVAQLLSSARIPQDEHKAFEDGFLAARRK